MSLKTLEGVVDLLIKEGKILEEERAWAVRELQKLIHIKSVRCLDELAARAVKAGLLKLANRPTQNPANLTGS